MYTKMKFFTLDTRGSRGVRERNGFWYPGSGIRALVPRLWYPGYNFFCVKFFNCYLYFMNYWTNKYFTNLDIKCSRNQSLNRVDLVLSLLKSEILKQWSLWQYSCCPSSPRGSLKFIYFVKVIPFEKAQTRPLQNLKNEDPPINCLKKLSSFF